jgi:hypothetical protein
MSRTDTLSIELGANYDDSYDPGDYDDHAGQVCSTAGNQLPDLTPPF